MRLADQEVVDAEFELVRGKSELRGDLGAARPHSDVVAQAPMEPGGACENPVAANDADARGIAVGQQKFQDEGIGIPVTADDLRPLPLPDAGNRLLHAVRENPDVAVGAEFRASAAAELRDVDPIVTALPTGETIVEVDRNEGLAGHLFLPDFPTSGGR